jgi:hypothetical protein
LEKKKIESYAKDDDHSESFFNLYTDLVG